MVSVGQPAGAYAPRATSPARQSDATQVRADSAARKAQPHAVSCQPASQPACHLNLCHAQADQRNCCFGSQSAALHPPARCAEASTSGSPPTERWLQGTAFTESRSHLCLSSNSGPRSRPLDLQAPVRTPTPRRCCPPLLLKKVGQRGRVVQARDLRPERSEQPPGPPSPCPHSPTHTTRKSPHHVRRTLSPNNISQATFRSSSRVLPTAATREDRHLASAGPGGACAGDRGGRRVVGSVRGRPRRGAPGCWCQASGRGCRRWAGSGWVDLSLLSWAGRQAPGTRCQSPARLGGGRRGLTPGRENETSCLSSSYFLSLSSLILICFSLFALHSFAASLLNLHSARTSPNHRPLLPLRPHDALRTQLSPLPH